MSQNLSSLPCPKAREASCTGAEGLRIKRFALADKLRFTAHLPMLTESVFGLAPRLASFGA